MGILFWNGILHGRCRLTPFPIKMPRDCFSTMDPCWNYFLEDAIKQPDLYRCLPDANDDQNWTQSTSPWFRKGPQNCVWPIDDNDQRICSLSGIGLHSCPPSYSSWQTKAANNRTCGSNFDRFGNNRFLNDEIPYGFPRMKSGTFLEDLNWGFTTYDSFFTAFITTFQVITLEGWTDVMNQVVDAWYFCPTVVIFCVEVILCGYIVLNLVLAVITNSLEEHVHEYFDMPVDASPYMQYVARCKFPDLFPAIVHKDGTSRVQTVTQKQHPGLYMLLREFYKRTGCPMILNTSLNIKGQPIVNDVEDAALFAKHYGVPVHISD